MFRLDKKVVVLVGGSGLLGSEFSKALLTQGAKLYSIDLKKGPKLNSLKKYKNYNFRICDATDEKALKNLRGEIEKKEGHIDVLINSTTMQAKGFYLPFEELSLEGWETVIKGDLTVPFITSRIFLKQMRKQRYGSVINFSSIYGIVGNDQRIYKGSNLAQAYTGEKGLKQIYSHPAYNAAKGGIITFTKFLAAYYGKFNIRVNCISPGGIDSGKENKVFLKNYSARVPLARKARINEISGAVVYLASDESSYVSGHNLVVDGGYTAW